MEEYDLVRVSNLLKSERYVDGSEGVVRQPEVGDEGTVVHVHSPGRAYIVECVDSQGLTIWLADFVSAELEELGNDSRR